MARLLLLEDDPDIAESLQAILALDGHEVRCTASGKEALLWAAREPWDLVMLDVDVEELPGLAAASAIGDFRSMPTLVLSAGGSDWRRRAFAAGAAACLRKPFELVELRKLVATLATAPRGGRETRVARLSAAELARVRKLTPTELDALPYGVIRVDRAGVIVGFNQYESSASGLPPGDVLGRPFAEVAPCTQVQSFAGAIADGIRARTLDRVLRFVFPTYGAISVVSVRLYFDEERDNIWIFVSRRAQCAADRVAGEELQTRPEVAQPS